MKAWPIVDAGREGACRSPAGLPEAFFLEAAGLSGQEAARRALSLLDLAPADSAPRRKA